MKESYFDTPIGQMVAIADEKALYLLEFVERKGLERELARFKQKTSGTTPPIVSIKEELKRYFAGELTEFKTSVSYGGTPFQLSVFEALRKIPSGSTCSYSDLAHAIGRPTACRAVARANSTNQLAIIVPCHRVINANGDLGGYAGGLSRKEWLIKLEHAVREGKERAIKMNNSVEEGKERPIKLARKR